jgi:acylpyruvate hydrolase
MRLLTIRTPEGTRAARLEGDQVVELPFGDVGAVLSSGPTWVRTVATSEGVRLAIGEVDLAPVVTHPEKIICLGLNYRSHIQEMGRDLPAYPTMFSKFRRAMVGPQDPIVLPPESDEPDWEVELGLLIGRPARRVRGAEAEGAIAGFCVVNDVTMRDWQRRTTQYLQGKTFERTTPVGPMLVTPEEVDGARDLELTCEVDGKVMQRGRTSDLLFSPVELVEYISTVVTLMPGDLIATGTPAGVGAARTPPAFLRPGQIVRASIEGIGELVNECVADDVTAYPGQEP